MRRSFRLASGLAVALFATAAISSSAGAQVEMSGVRAMGMGEAFTGGPSGDGSFYYNLAGISALMMYAIETSYAYDQATGRNMLHASIVDGKSNPRLGGGIAYTYSTSAENAELPDFTGHDIYGGLSTPIVPGWVILGAGIHFLNYDWLGDDEAKGVTLDLGLFVALGDSIGFGAAGRNLISVEDSGLDRETRFGLSYRGSRIQLGFDTLLQFTDTGTVPSYMAGLEVMAVETLPIRVGYKYDGPLEHHIVSGGLGWRSEMVGVDALFRQDVNQSDHRIFGIAVNLYL